MSSLSALSSTSGRLSLVTREEEIFAAALALSGRERREYLDRACGDDRVLRENVESLLEAHASAEDFLSSSPADDVFATVEPRPGERIGPYVIVRKLGEGGCGLVFLAEQERPLRRRVALKIIKPGMDSKQVIARFEAERQTLAQMEHPDIARVFDAGTTPTGHPYFVMEYVDGVPVTRFCDETALPLAARLELFERICLALQHAHQKGVVHRDVKPSNILVVLHDGRPVPKIIDFGIAKATQARLTDATQLTGFEQFLGTPAYMSPEQAERRDLDIDTRSDIYSLGVLLYELLTGQPPFDPKSLVRAGVDEIRRIIREVDPPRPSTALSTLAGDKRTTVARRRAAAPERLTSVLRGDLDWIVMRCMEKDRARRYGTANELAEDIRRHLRSEPVTARPPSTAYRIRKFVRRHRVACAAAAAVALALVAGAAVSTWQAIRATRAEREARLAQTDAQRRQAEAEDMLTFMLGDFRTELQKIGRLKLLGAVGDKANAYFANLDSRDQNDTTLLRHAKALTQIGEVRLDEGRFADALQAFQVAHTRAVSLCVRQPLNGEYLFTRGQVEYWLGFTHRRKGDLATATQWWIAYRDTTVRLAALDPNNSAWQIELGYGHHNLAVLEIDRGHYDAARTEFLAEMELFERASAARPGGPDAPLRQKIADLHSWLGLAAEGSGNYPEARIHYVEQVRLLELLVKDEPANVRWQPRLALAWFRQALLETVMGEHTEAMVHLQSAGKIYDALCTQDPENRAWARARLTLRLRQAQLLLADQSLTDAAAILSASAEPIEKLALAEPASADFALLLAQRWRLEAELRAIQGREGATDAALRAVQIGEKVVGTELSSGSGIGEFLATCANSAAMLDHDGKGDQARPYRLRIIALTKPYLETSRDWRLLDPAARALAGEGEIDQARTLVKRLTEDGYRPLVPWPESLLSRP